MPPTEVLKDERGRSVVRIGETVRRRAYPWAASIHALLTHLRAVGFSAAPVPLDLTADGYETLSFIPGISGKDTWPLVADEAGLTAFARLLRHYHDAVRSFTPPPDATWALTDTPLGPDQIVCHNDVGPWNAVWSGTTPIGLLDWDLAGPGDPLDDVAYALEYTAPFRDDQTAVRWHAFPNAPNRPRRIELFATAYGLTQVDGLTDRVIRRQRADVDHIRHLAARGFEPQLTWLTDGTLARTAARAEWSEEHRYLFR